MTEKKLVPKRRFEGFISDWTVRNLGEILDLLKDGTHGTHRNVEAGIYLLSAKNIKNGKVNIDSTDRIISREEYEKIHRNFELRSGDILLTVVGSIGQAAILQRNIDFTFQRSVAYLRPNREIESNFLYTMVRSNYFQWELKNRQVVSAQPGIYLGDLSKIPIAFPVLKEQQKIGNFFKHLDQMISLEQRKLEKTKALKSAYLAEMFPAEGERVPKRRFAGFTGEWKPTRLEELAEVRTGKAFSSLDFNDDGEYLVITNKNVQNQENNLPLIGDRIDLKNKSIINDYVLNGINVLVTMDGVNIGETGKIKHEKAVLAQRVGRLNSDQIEFVYQITKSNAFILEMKKVSVGNAIKHISLKQIAEYSFLAPLLKAEQKAIGEFFKKMDDSIRNQQQKLSKLKAMKLAYLEEMFV